MKILIGGSPCTRWSIAQTKNRETEASGIGWELFLNYRIARDKLGVDITVYYATEIDKYAIQTTQHNYPETVQLGDAFQVRDDEWRPRRAAEVE